MQLELNTNGRWTASRKYDRCLWVVEAMLVLQGGQKLVNDEKGSSWHMLLASSDTSTTG